MKRFLASLTLIVLASPATLALADDKDMDKLAGKWTAKAGPDGNTPVNLKFDKEKKTVEISFTTPSGDEKKIAGLFDVAPDAKPFATMKWTKMKVDDRDLPDNLAIYKFDDHDKTLKLAGGGTDSKGGPGKPPTEFVEKKGATPGNTLVFTRVDEKK